ncbi:MAG: ribosome biogenesis GTPase YlqF [Bacilli bacterium]|nr:ribosome biogenesis GTPase YlqF [Bacilli bacterium]
MDMYQKREERKNKKMNEDGKSFSNVSINWYPGHMAKTKREIKEKIDLIDVVYEVIDARMPISSKIVDIDNLVRNKPRILIVTKYDLCDRTHTDMILDNYIKKGFSVVKVDLINGNNVGDIISLTNKILVDMNEKRKLKGMKPRAIRALIVGIPNVGKSTLINRLVGRKAVNVGNKPGVTKSLSWIRINKDIELLDSPGILWPKLANQDHAYNLASLSSIKEEILNVEDIAMYILKTMNRLYPNNLKERYGIESIDFDNIEETLDAIAIRRGALKKGGVCDYDKVYYIIIRDIKDGLLGRVTFDRM